MNPGAIMQRGVRGIGRLAAQRAGVLGTRVRNLHEAQHSVTVGRSPEEVYAFWRDPQQLSGAFGHFAELSASGPDRVHWRARSAAGETLEWDAQVVDEQPGRLLRWRSLDGSPVVSEGQVRFTPAPNDLGTEVTLRLCVDAPAGGPNPLALSADVIVIKAIRRAKALVETGEAPTLERNPAARPATAPGHAR